MDAIDNPPKDNPRLRKLLSRKPVWERASVVGSPDER